MKRFHVHVGVEDLDKSIRFYSTIFGVNPTVQKTDYAKWMLEDPRINFAISSRGRAPGVDHLGFQVDSADELRGLQTRLEAADSGLIEQTGTTCCYARADKYWVTDPSGIAWESYHTLSDAPMFGVERETAKSACCAPQAEPSRAASTSVQGAPEKACCN